MTIKHELILLFICEFCEKAFSQSSNLTRHKEKDECDLCEKWFTTYGSLNKHKQSHSWEKKFKCYLCHLTRHKEKDKCDLCGKWFTTYHIW